MRASPMASSCAWTRGMCYGSPVTFDRGADGRLVAIDGLSNSSTDLAGFLPSYAFSSLIFSEMLASHGQRCCTK